MSLEIQFGRTSAPRNALNKNPNFTYTTTGTLRGKCDILNPVIEIKSGTEPLKSYVQFNYMYIKDFLRYYYIEWSTIREGIAQVTGHVDPLYTYRGAILANTGLVLRTATKSQITKMLDDGCFKTYSDDHIVTQKFTGDTFTNGTFILAVAGS